jgi:adenylate kinase family enzyme
LLNFYSSQGILVSVDGLGTEQDVQQRIVNAIESRR